MVARPSVLPSGAMTTNSTSNDMSGFPKNLLSWVLAIGGKKAPAVTALMIGALVVFVIALAVLRLSRDIDLWKVLLMAVSGVAIGLVALLAAKGAARRRAGTLAEIVAWIFATAFFSVIILIITVIFFGVPRAGALFVARLINAPQIASSSPTSAITIKESVSLTGLDSRFRRPPNGRDQIERVASLSNYPALSVNRAVLSARPGDHLYVAANSLELIDSTIVTNGASITIEVLHLTSINSRIRSFESGSLRRSNDPVGGGTVTLIVHDQTAGAPLAVDLSGEAGAPGTAGVAGSSGAQGASGNDAADHLFDCAHGPGDGSAGGKGGPGAAGSPGMDGGDGGTLVLVGAISRSAIDFKSDAGPGGDGGMSGHGGTGGPGGAGGSSSHSTYCRGSGHAGPQGAEGDAGPQGAPGRNGKPGELLTKRVEDALQ